MSSTKKPNDKELLELGKKLQAFYETGYIDRKQALKYTFIKSLIAGFGAFLGGTILVALLLWILSFFDQVTLVDHIVKIIHHGLQQ